MTPPQASTPPTGNLVEIFSGIQGEGPHAGRRQIFLRLAGCNLSCEYCDQPEARTVPPTCLIEETPGRRDFRREPNPVEIGDAVRAILRLHTPRRLHHAVAVTGGEPLLQAGFLATLLPLLRRKRLQILIETNGTRPTALRALLPCVNIVSIDIKLRSASSRRMPVARHREFLRVAARRGVFAYCKAVVCDQTTPAEVIRAARMIRAVRRSMPLILQPLTASRQAPHRPPRPDVLLQLQEAAAQILEDVRVIPQIHKFIDQH